MTAPADERTPTTLTRAVRLRRARNVSRISAAAIRSTIAPALFARDVGRDQPLRRLRRRHALVDAMDRAGEDCAQALHERVHRLRGDPAFAAKRDRIADDELVDAVRLRRSS